MTKSVVKNDKVFYTYDELHALLNAHLGNKEYGYIKAFCDKHKLKHSYVLNLLSNKNYKYPTLMVKIAGILGYKGKMIKNISYTFVLNNS